jgi:hypothetical protein
MTLKIYICTLCLVAFLFSCKKTTRPRKIISVNPNDAEEVINLSQFIDSVKYIKLQTDSNCILGQVLSIEIKDKYIYAMDISQHSIVVFDKKGRYVSKLDKQGKGPDEYPFIGHFVIDDNEKYIEMITYPGKILKYSNLTFELLDTYSIPDINLNGVRKEDSVFYIATQQMDNMIEKEKTNASIFIVKNGKVEKTLFNKTIATNGSGYWPNVESFTKNDKGELFVSIMYDNTFYKLDKMRANPVFTVDFGRYGINNSIGNKSLQKQLAYLKKTNNRASFPVLNINNSDIMAFSYYFKQDRKNILPQLSDLRQFIKIKTNNQIFHTKRFRNDITNFPEDISICIYNHIGHEAWYKNYLVDIVIPGIYFRNNKTKSMVKGLGEVTINDNPIIVLMKLKNTDIKN